MLRVVLESRTSPRGSTCTSMLGCRTDLDRPGTSPSTTTGLLNDSTYGLLLTARRARCSMLPVCRRTRRPVASSAVTRRELGERRYRQRMYPWSPFRARGRRVRSSVEAVASALMLLAATIASACPCVHSSTMLSSFRTRPSACLVELEVQRPDVVRPRQRAAWRRAPPSPPDADACVVSAAESGQANW